MISKPLNNPIITVSIKVYQALLLAYPTKFQQEYGSQMAQVFQDCCLRTVRQGGTNGMLKLWAVTLFDLLQSVISEHMQKETDMNKDDFARLGGWLLMASAVAFLPGAIGMILSETRYAIRSWDSFPFNVVAFAVFWAPVLLAVGMLGLRARYKIGGGVLLFGAVVGGLLVIVGTLVQFLTPDYSVSETYYGVWLGGVFLLYVCLFIFGILALIQKPLPRWNALPLIAGGVPLLRLLAGITTSSLEASLLVIIAGYIIMTIAMILLGYILQADASQNTASA